MKRVCCRRRGKRGFAGLIEIIVVAALILGGFALYMGLMGGGSGRGGGLMDPTGTTTAIEMQNELQGGSARQAPEGRPAENARPPAATGPGAGATGAPPSSQTGGVNTSPIMPSSIPGRAVRKARGEQCQENLRQLRYLIQMATDNNDGTFPASLTDIDGSIQVRSCSVGGQDYVYDPTTGRVRCTTPGHEAF